MDVAPLLLPELWYSYIFIYQLDVLRAICYASISGIEGCA